MAVDGEEERRTVGQDAVEVGAGGPLGSEHVHAPTESADRAGRDSPSRSARSRPARRPPWDLQIDPGVRKPPRNGMDVALDEARHEQPAVQIDHPGLRTGESIAPASSPT